MKGAFYVGTDTARVPEVKLGLRWLLGRLEAGEQGLIVAPTLRHYESSDLVTAIGGAAASTLRRERIIHGTRGSVVRAETSQTYRRSSWRGGPVLVLWPDASLLDQLSDDRRVTDLCAIPWLFDDFRQRIAAHQAVDLAGGAAPPAPAVITNPVVLKAMESLTLRVNLSTGLGHPSDRDAAIEAFRALRKANHDWRGEEIQAWAVAHGWSNQDARELRTVADGIASGRALRSRGHSWRRDIVAVWEADAQGREPPPFPS